MLTYDDSANLMIDIAFRGRIKVACLKFASFIFNEDANIPVHNTRMKWATSALLNPDSVAAQYQPAVVMDPIVQTDGTNTTDAALQNAVEGVVNKLM